MNSSKWRDRYKLMYSKIGDNNEENPTGSTSYYPNYSGTANAGNVLWRDLYKYNNPAERSTGLEGMTVVTPTTEPIKSTDEKDKSNDKDTTTTTPTTPTLAPFAFSQQGAYDEAMKTFLNNDFVYNLEEDPFYKQLSDRYTKQAQLAMEDAMGRAAAMTGGYGNSYAQSVAQQAYFDQMSNLDDAAMSLYSDAYNKWRDKKSDAYNQLGVLDALKTNEYNQYLVDNGLVDTEEEDPVVIAMREMPKIKGTLLQLYNEKGGGEEGRNALRDLLYDFGYNETTIGYLLEQFMMDYAGTK